MTIEKVKYQCQYCLRKLLSEKSFMKHKCPEMLRNEQLKSVDGQGAYVHYCYWMKCGGRKAPPIETFKTSSYFSSFYKFSQFIKDVNLPNPERYIELMVAKKIAPLLWTKTECYAIYLSWYDTKEPPLQQVKITIDTILDLSEAAEIAPKELFSVLHIRDIIQLIQERKLSPWFLLCSKSFKEKLSLASEEDHKELLRLININYWATKLNENETLVKQIKNIALEMEM